MTTLRAKAGVNTTWMFAGSIGRLLTQGLYLALLARVLGAEAFGAFAATLALLTMIAPFSGLGSGEKLVMYVSRDRALFPTYWGNGLLSIFITGGFLTIVALLFCRFILGHANASMFVLPIIISELWFGRITEMCGQVFQGFERLQFTAGLSVTNSLVKLMAILSFSGLVTRQSLEVWSVWYLSASFLTSLIGFLVVVRYYGLPQLSNKEIRKDARLGFFFSIGVASKSVSTDIDKTMLARMTTLEITGIYSMAYRTIMIAFSPIHAMLSATISKFFRAGAKGVANTLNFTLRLAPVTFAYSVMASTILYFAAPFLPLVLGVEYAPSVMVLRWLAVIPILQAIHYLAANTLTGAGFQNIRGTIQLAAAGINIMLNLWLIPVYSWKGAAWSTIGSEALLCVLLCGSLAHVYRRDESRIDSAMDREKKDSPAYT